MKATLLIFATCVACGWCATQGLTSVPQRPTPINPAVISEPKPAEKVTVIKDPKEVEKYKREAQHKDAKPAPGSPIKGPTPVSVPKRSQAVKATQPPPATHTHEAAKNRPKRDQHGEATVKPEPLIHRHPEPVDAAKKPEESDAHKRDIPVPLVAKYDHPEESPQSGEVSTTKKPSTPDTETDHIQVIPPKKHNAPQTNSETTTTTTSTSASVVHPAVRPHPVPVSELFARPIPQSKN